jgi:hypothetical protein
MPAGCSLQQRVLCPLAQQAAAMQSVDHVDVDVEGSRAVSTKRRIARRRQFQASDVGVQHARTHVHTRTHTRARPKRARLSLAVAIRKPPSPALADEDTPVLATALELNECLGCARRECECVP